MLLSESNPLWDRVYYSLLPNPTCLVILSFEHLVEQPGFNISHYLWTYQILWARSDEVSRCNHLTRMEGSLSVPFPQCNLHTVNGREDVRHRQTPSTKNHVSCSGSYGEEWLASPKLASQPVLQVFQKSMSWTQTWSSSSFLSKVQGVETSRCVSGWMSMCNVFWVRSSTLWTCFTTQRSSNASHSRFSLTLWQGEENPTVNDLLFIRDNSNAQHIYYDIYEPVLSQFKEAASGYLWSLSTTLEPFCIDIYI